MTWAFITGEYPPQTGGVSDYTRLVATGLADCGDEVHVWAPECTNESEKREGVTVHRLPGRYGVSALRQLDAELRRLTAPCLFVQYVPHVFGWKAMNVPFCLWLRSRKEPVWSMFHEVCYPRRWNQRPAEHLLGAVTYEMARVVASASERIFYSTAAWLPLLHRLAPSTPKTSLPVPSNLAETVDRSEAAALRYGLSSISAAVVIGHFGTYGVALWDCLIAIFSSLLLADARRVALFAGRGSTEFRKAFLQTHTTFSDRTRAVETECADTLAMHLAACDLLVQPYPDGVTTRRSSLMAGLALGKPIVTNLGPLTEPFWKQSGAVAVAPDMVAQSLVKVVEELLSSTPELPELGLRAAHVYRETFALSHTVKTLRAS